MKRANHFWISLLVVALVTIPTLALADGEPGAQCPGCDTGKCQYIAPPYTGTVVAVWKASCSVDGANLNNCILIKGSVKQVGKTECDVDFNWTLLGAGDWTTQDYFLNLNPSDLRGSCLIELQQAGGFPCIQTGYPELLAVGNLKYGGPECTAELYDEMNCLTAKAVIMQVMVMQ